MKIVLVDWVDSASVGGWAGEEDLNVCECKTVGFLLRKTKDKVVVAQSISPRDAVEVCDNRFAIPRGCIKSIRELK